MSKHRFTIHINLPNNNGSDKITQGELAHYLLSEITGSRSSEGLFTETQCWRLSRASFKVTFRDGCGDCQINHIP